MPAVVFLAHARADTDLVAKVRCATDAAGLRLWSEFTDTPADAPVPATLMRIIDECALFAVLLTARSVQRPWVRWELEHALSIGKTPIVAIVDQQDLMLPRPFDQLSREAHVPLQPLYTLATHLAALSPPTESGLPCSTRSATELSKATALSLDRSQPEEQAEGQRRRALPSAEVPPRRPVREARAPTDTWIRTLSEKGESASGARLSAA